MLTSGLRSHFFTVKKKQPKTFFSRDNTPLPTSHEVTVLADKDLPYSFLKKILSTCTAAEYGKVSLAVLERERAYRGAGAG